MSQSSDDGVANPSFSSDEEEMEALPEIGLLSPSPSIQSNATSPTGSDTKRSAEDDDDGQGRAKRIRHMSETAQEAERKRIQAKEEAAERRMATLIKQREKVLDKQLPKPKLAATDLLKTDPNRAETAKIFEVLEKQSMKDFEREQQAKAMEMVTAGAKGLTAERQGVLKASRVQEMPNHAPTVDLFPRLAVKRSLKVAILSEMAEDPAPYLTQLISTVQRQTRSDGGEELVVEFLRSNTIQTVGGEVQLTPHVADWLFSLLAWVSDTAAIQSCVSTLRTCFFTPPRTGWWLSASMLATMLCRLGATSESLLLEQCGTPVKGVIDVVHCATVAGAVGDPDADKGDTSQIEAMLFLLFRLSVDQRCDPLAFALGRAVTELLELVDGESWPHVKSRLAVALLEHSSHFHGLVTTTGLLGAQGTRCRELRAAICRRFIPTLFSTRHLKLPGPDVAMDDVTYFTRVLLELNPHVEALSDEEDGYYRLHCMHQLMDSSTPLEPCTSEQLVKVERLKKALAVHRSKFKGEYDLSRADVRVVIHALTASHRRMKDMVEHSVPSDKKKQSTLQGIFSGGVATKAV